MDVILGDVGTPLASLFVHNKKRLTEVSRKKP